MAKSKASINTKNTSKSKSSPQEKALNKKISSTQKEEQIAAKELEDVRAENEARKAQLEILDKTSAESLELLKQIEAEADELEDQRIKRTELQWAAKSQSGQELENTKKEIEAVDEKISHLEYSQNVLSKEKRIAEDIIKQREDLTSEIEKGTDAEDRIVEKLDIIHERQGQISKDWNTLKKDQRELIENTDAWDASFNSITGKLKTFEKLNESVALRGEAMHGTLDSISQIIQSLPEDQKKLVAQATASTDAYRNMETSILSAGQMLDDQKITVSQYNALLKEQDEAFTSSISKIDQSTEAGKELVKTLTAAYESTKSFTQAAAKSEKMLGGINTAMDQLGSSGIPIANELSSVFKSMADGDIPGIKLGLIALGAALGALAAKTVFAGWQVDIEMANQRLQNSIDLLKQIGQNQVKFGTGSGEDFKVSPVVAAQAKVDKGGIDIGQKKKEIETVVDIASIRKNLDNQILKSRIDNAEEVLRLENDAANASAKAAISFSASLKQGAAQFQAAAKTALFGKGLGSVGYGAAQLQLAGISADKIASAMRDTAKELGQMPTAKVASDIGLKFGSDPLGLTLVIVKDQDPAPATGQPRR